MQLRKHMMRSLMRLMKNLRMCVLQQLVIVAANCFSCDYIMLYNIIYIVFYNLKMGLSPNHPCSFRIHFGVPPFMGTHHEMDDDPQGRAYFLGDGRKPPISMIYSHGFFSWYPNDVPSKTNILATEITISVWRIEPTMNLLHHNVAELLEKIHQDNPYLMYRTYLGVQLRFGYNEMVPWWNKANKLV